MKIIDVVKTYNLKAYKKYGQHFLTDPRILNKIASFANINEFDNVVEIGPGPGGLTRALLASNPLHVFAIEIDKRCIESLDAIEDKSKLTVIESDALLIDLDETINSNYKIVANLPYNIGTKLIVKWLTKEKNVTSITSMLQKEVAIRMTAKPGTKDYGRLSVLVQLLGDVSIKMHLSKGAFSPPPKVASSVIHIDLKKNIDRSIIEKLEIVTHLIFSNRRKTLKNALENAFVKEIEGFDMSIRGETLSPEQILDLSKKL